MIRTRSNKDTSYTDRCLRCPRGTFQIFSTIFSEYNPNTLQPTDADFDDCFADCFSGRFSPTAWYIELKSSPCSLACFSTVPTRARPTQAKLAEEAERYEDMVTNVKALAELNVQARARAQARRRRAGAPARRCRRRAEIPPPAPPATTPPLSPPHPPPHAAQRGGAQPPLRRL